VYVYVSSVWFIILPLLLSVSRIVFFFFLVLGLQINDIEPFCQDELALYRQCAEKRVIVV